MISRPALLVALALLSCRRAPSTASPAGTATGPAPSVPTASAPTTIATPAAAPPPPWICAAEPLWSFPGSPSMPPEAIALDSTSVYAAVLRECPKSNAGIWRIGRASGAAAVVLRRSTLVEAMAAGDGLLAFTDVDTCSGSLFQNRPDPHRLIRMQSDGGAETGWRVEAQGPGGQTRFTGLALVGGVPYVTTSLGTVERPRTGGEAQVLARVPGEAFSPVAVNGYVYFGVTSGGHAGSIARVPLEGGEARTVVQDDVVEGVASVVRVGNLLAYLVRPRGGASAIRAVPLGDTPQIARDLVNAESGAVFSPDGALAVARGAAVYVVKDAAGRRSIRAVSPASGSTWTVVAAQAGLLVADDTSLYWVDDFSAARSGAAGPPLGVTGCRIRP